MEGEKREHQIRYWLINVLSLLSCGLLGKGWEIKQFDLKYDSAFWIYCDLEVTSRTVKEVPVSLTENMWCKPIFYLSVSNGSILSGSGAGGTTRLPVREEWGWELVGLEQRRCHRTPW